MANWIITDSVNLRHPMVNTQGTAAEVLMLPLDNKAHTWQVVVRDGYADADLSGKSCYAYFVRKDNVKVLVNGTITGNVCSVTLDSTCYAEPGFLRAVMILSATDETIAIYEKTFRVNPALPDQTVDPGETIPSIDDLLAEIGAMRLATADANAAASAAQSATTAANTAAQTATTNANAAQTAANNATQATTAANQATTAANTAAQNANTKADAAQSAANNAYQAATSATEATSAAQTAANDANTAAQNANRVAQSLESEVNEIKEDISDLQDRVSAIENMNGLHRYGVTGIGLADTQLTRLYDAVGMTAQVGTDGDNSNIINNFDDVAPFNRRKCVGEWSMYEGKPVFHVNAYYGDPDYTEDGSMGDYVAVDCTPAYYMYDKVNGTLVISAHHYEGYRPFDCLMDRTTNECRPHTYLPCYALAVKNGHAVSLPGLRNEQGDYKKLFNTCKTAANDAASQAILMPIAVNFYEWAMFTVEFATTNCQSVMQGCANLRHSNDDLIIMSSETEGIVQNHQADRVSGEYVSIQPSNVDINTYTWLASHRIVSVERCDQDGTPNASGTYDHVTFEVLDNTRTIEAGTTYRFAARPYNTGACNTVSTPSGSPVNNQNGYYPMKYRWRENVYGNQFQTVADLMNFAVVEEGFTDANANYAAHLEWYYHRDPETLTPTNYANSTAGRDAMIAAGWELLDVSTPAENYINGYVKSRDYSHKYPDVCKPGLTVGASVSTYYADHAYLVLSYLLRAVRLGGSWSSGSNAGFSSAFAYAAPSDGSAIYGGSLYYPQ